MPLTPEVRDAAWRALLSAHGRVVGRLEQAIALHADLPLSSYDVLAALATAPEGRLRMQDLADTVVLSRSGLTRLVQRMEADRLVVREACDDDRRGTFAVLTPEGHSRWLAARGVHAEVVEQAFTDLDDPGQADVLVRALEQVAAAADGR